MVCPTYNRRHLHHGMVRTSFARFDQHYAGNEGFIRPVRQGQTAPSAPSDVPKEGAHYLVQNLDGEWLVLLSSDNPREVSAEIQESDGIPMWMH